MGKSVPFFPAVTHPKRDPKICWLVWLRHSYSPFPWSWMNEQVTFSLFIRWGEISARGARRQHSHMTRLAVFVHKHLAESSCTLAACSPYMPSAQSLGVVFMCTARTFSASQYNRMSKEDPADQWSCTRRLFMSMERTASSGKIYAQLCKRVCIIMLPWLRSQSASVSTNILN